MPNTEFDDEFSEANVLLGDKIGHVRRHYFRMLDAYEKQMYSTVVAVGVATAEGAAVELSGGVKKRKANVPSYPCIAHDIKKGGQTKQAHLQRIVKDRARKGDKVGKRKGGNGLGKRGK